MHLWRGIGIAKMRASLPLMGLLLSAPIAGCRRTVSVKPPIDQAPLIAPAPVSVGIYYSEDLRNHTCTGSEWLYVTFSWTIALGPPSIEMFDILFKALFTDVEILAADPKITHPRDQRDFIELRLLEFNGCEVSLEPIDKNSVEIAYEAIVWSADGVKVAQWKGQGRAGPRDDLERYGSTFYLSALTSEARRKAAADFIVNFENDPAVRAWLGE